MSGHLLTINMVSVVLGMLYGLLAWSVPARALDNGLSLMPPMGYNTWNAFGCGIDEESARDNVDLVVKLGLRDAGYKYFNLDDCWQSTSLVRNAQNRVECDPLRFPSGIKPLADWVHQQGMRFGMYSDSGLLTCGMRLGSLGFEDVDAWQFAEWGVDFLKYDNCFTPSLQAMSVQSRYVAMRDALNSTGRPILFSMCEWGTNEPYLWGAKVGNAWRTTQDIKPVWDTVLRCLDNNIGLAMHAGPGGWNDPDMLEVGNGVVNMNLNRSQAHFSLWALLKAPLLISTDLRAIDEHRLAILLNAEVIAINQDALGVAGDLIYQHGPGQIFAAPLVHGCRAVAFFNRQPPPGDDLPMTVTWSKLGYPSGLFVSVRDLQLHRDLDPVSQQLIVPVPTESVVLVKLCPLIVPEGGDLVAQGDRRLAGVQHGLPGSKLVGDLEAISDLDAWRPWHHGFFD